MNGNNEFDLFREMMTDVTPMQHETVEKATVKHDTTQSKIAGRISAQSLSDKDEDHLSLECTTMVKPEDITSFKQSGVQDGVYRKLKLGTYDIHARLDLRGGRAGLFWQLGR